MKKLLGLIGTFTLTASAVNPMMACTSPAVRPTYQTVIAAIKVLNLTSYVKNGTKDVSEVTDSIKKDAQIILVTNNYEPGVNFNVDALKIDRVINVKNDRTLVQDDLFNDTVLSLIVTFTYNGESTEASSSTLNITTKTDQAIIDYINDYNFNKFISKWFVPVGITLEKFKNNLETRIIPTLGSFLNLIDQPSFKTNSIEKDNDDLSQDDFNKTATLNLTINYKYKAIDNQNISFKINISKTDIAKITVSYADLAITLPDTSKNHLTETAVDKIKKAITTAIQTALAPTGITTTDYEVTGIETTVQEGANFSSQKTVTFAIIAKSDSVKFTGKLENQKINVTVSDTYQTVIAAIKALKLTSYAKNGTKDVSEVTDSIKKDAQIILVTNNYELGVNFNVNALKIDRVINVKNDRTLVQDDLISDTILSLIVTFTYNGESTEASSSTLNVTTKTDQAIVDCINSYNFNKVMTKVSLPVRMPVANFTNDIQSGSFLVVMGSFSNLIDQTSFKANSIKKGNDDLSQDDFNKEGTFNLTINYKYKAIDKQNISFKINISKIDIAKITVPYADLAITLPDASKNSLTEIAVDKIKKAITTAIKTALAPTGITTTDYEVTGIEATVKKGVDFSNQKEVTFNIIVKNDSAKFTGKLENQKIKVTVSDKT